MKNYKYAIMVHGSLRNFSNPFDSPDWLIDDNLIKKDEVIFLTYKYFDDTAMRYFESKGLNYIRNIDEYLKIKNFKINTIKLRIIYYYWRWSSLLEHIRFNKLITYCDFSPQSQARNKVLAREGIETFYYTDSTDYGGYFGEYYNSFVETMFKNLHYDHLITWCDEIKYFLMQYNTGIKHYHNFGLMFGDIVRDIMKHKADSQLREYLIKRGYNLKKHKLIAVFDTAYIDTRWRGTATEMMGIKFICQIADFHDEHKNVFIVFKEKKKREELSERLRFVYESYERSKDERFAFIKEWKYSTLELVALADITISYPFSTPSAYALAVGKKGVWFDPWHKYKNVLYDKLGVVIFNRDEILNRRYKKPKYFQSKGGIDKFRKLLRGEL